MTQKHRIVDSRGTKNGVKVTDYGQLVTGDIDYSTPVAKTLTAINTAYNFVTPIRGKKIVITAMLLYANKGVGVNDATVDIYQADAIDSLVVDTSIISTEMVKQTSRDLLGLSMIVPEGKWINAKTDDASLFITIMYYYVPVD